MRLFIALGGLLVLVLSAVLVAPFFIDWTAYRTNFEREASRILGQPVRVLGEAEARLLPFPTLTFTDVVVGEPDAEPVLTLGRFRMDAELAPYLSGEIRIFEMTLDEPHWRVALGSEPNGLPTLTGAGGSTIVLENVVVTNGRVSLRNEETGRSREFSGLDGRIAAQTLNGPFTGSGRVTAMGEPMGFSFSAGQIEENGRWPLRLTLGSQRLGVDLTFDGQTILGDSAPDFTGRFALASRALAEGETRTLPPLNLNALVEMSPREARFTEMRAEVGSAETPYVVTGEGTFDIGDIPHFDLALRGEQVNVDELVGETGEVGGTHTFATRAVAVRATLLAIPRIDIPGRVDLTLPIVTAGDTTIRDLRFTGSPTGEGWTVRDLRAELPGQTLLEASGVLDIRERFGFAGDVLVAARQPGRFAEWMTGRPSPRVAQLAGAGFSAAVRLSAEEQRLDDLEVDVGGQRLVGRLERASDETLHTLSADLAGEAADLDAFLAFAQLFADGSEVMAPVDALDLRLEAGPVAYDGIEAGHFSLDLSYVDGVLDLRNAIARDLAGADLDASGVVTRVEGAMVPEITADITSEAPERLVALIAARWPALGIADLGAEAALLAPLAMTLDAAPAADGTGLDLRASGTADTTRIDIRGFAEKGLEAFSEGGAYRIDGEIEGTDAGALLRQLGASGLDLGLASPLRAEVTLAGAGAGPADIRASLTAPGSDFAVEGSFEPTRDAPSGSLAIETASEDAALWLTALGVPLAQGLDAVPAQLAGHFSFADGGWSFREIVGDVAGTAVSATLSGSSERPASGEARLGEVSLPWLATLLYGVPPDLAADDGLWPAEPFGEPLLPRAAFAVDVTADRLLLSPERVLTEFRGRIEGEEGRLRLSEAAADWAGGRLEGSLELRNAAGFGSLGFDAVLAGARIDEAGLAFGGTLDGRLAIEGSGRSYSELVASLTGEGEAELSQGRLGGIPEAVLPSILAAADRGDLAIENADVTAFVERLGARAEREIGTIRLPVTVAVGVARTTGPVTSEGESERLTGAGALDLRTGTPSGTLTLALLPDEDERIENTSPAVTYELAADAASWQLASVDPLVSFLSLRAYRQEQERLEALREELRETVRLRREARLYRWRAAEREQAAMEEQAAAEAERVRLEALEAQAAREAERRAAEAAAAAEAARQEAEAAREAAETSEPSPPTLELPAVPPFEFAVPEAPAEERYDGLPGVTPPLPSL